MRNRLTHDEWCQQGRQLYLLARRSVGRAPQQQQQQRRFSRRPRQKRKAPPQESGCSDSELSTMGRKATKKARTGENDSSNVRLRLGGIFDEMQSQNGREASKPSKDRHASLETSSEEEQDAVIPFADEDDDGAQNVSTLNGTTHTRETQLSQGQAEATRTSKLSSAKRPNGTLESSSDIFGGRRTRQTFQGLRQRRRNERLNKAVDNPQTVHFQVSSPQCWALVEGVVTLEKGEDTKSYLQELLMESRVELLPQKGRVLEILECLPGKWEGKIMSRRGYGAGSSTQVSRLGFLRDSSQDWSNKRLILRHEDYSSQEDYLSTKRCPKGYSIQVVDPSVLRLTSMENQQVLDGANYTSRVSFIASLSLVAFDGFASLTESELFAPVLASNVLKTCSDHPFWKSNRTTQGANLPDLFPISSFEALHPLEGTKHGSGGVTLLGNIVDKLNGPSMGYKILVLQDEESSRVVAMDVVFISTSHGSNLDSSPSVMSPSFSDVNSTVGEKAATKAVPLTSKNLELHEKNLKSSDKTAGSASANQSEISIPSSCHDESFSNRIKSDHQKAKTSKSPDTGVPYRLSIHSACHDDSSSIHISSQHRDGKTSHGRAQEKPVDDSDASSQASVDDMQLVEDEDNDAVMFSDDETAVIAPNNEAKVESTMSEKEITTDAPLPAKQSRDLATGVCGPLSSFPSATAEQKVTVTQMKSSNAAHSKAAMVSTTQVTKKVPKLAAGQGTQGALSALTKEVKKPGAMPFITPTPGFVHRPELGMTALGRRLFPLTNGVYQHQSVRASADDTVPPPSYNLDTFFDALESMSRGSNEAASPEEMHIGQELSNSMPTETKEKHTTRFPSIHDVFYGGLHDENDHVEASSQELQELEFPSTFNSNNAMANLLHMSSDFLYGGEHDEDEEETAICAAKWIASLLVLGTGLAFFYHLFYSRLYDDHDHVEASSEAVLELEFPSTDVSNHSLATLSVFLFDGGNDSDMPIPDYFV